jgi:hypothetical protein
MCESKEGMQQGRKRVMISGKENVVRLAQLMVKTSIFIKHFILLTN